MKKKNHARSPDKQGFSVALPKDLLAKIESLAAAETRSRNGQIQHLLEQALKTYADKNRPFEVVAGVAGKKRHTA